MTYSKIDIKKIREKRNKCKIVKNVRKGFKAFCKKIGESPPKYNPFYSQKNKAWREWSIG